MRVNDPQRECRVARISRRIVAAMALCGMAMPSMAAVDLIQTPPHVWVSAAVLSLALVTATNRPKN